MKKILTLCLAFVLCLGVFITVGCAPEASKNTLKVSNKDSIEIKQGADKMAALESLTFSYVNTTGEIQLQWDEKQQKNVSVKIQDFTDKKFKDCVLLGMTVSGYNSNVLTAEGETKVMTFSLYGVECELKYTVVE